MVNYNTADGHRNKQQNKEKQNPTQTKGSFGTRDEIDKVIPLISISRGISYPAIYI